MKTATYNWETIITSAILIVFAAYTAPSYAALSFEPSSDFNSMMANILLTLPAVVRLVFAVSYVMGIWFLYSALRDLKGYGGSTTMMPSQAKFGPPMLKILAGSLLLFAPGMIDITTYSLWGYGATSIIQYSSGAESSQGWGPVLKGTEAIIRLVGYIAFIRGLTLLVKGSQGGAQPGTTSKGITHMIGGILAINIVGTIEILKASLGL